MIKNNVFDYHYYQNVLQIIDEQVQLTPNMPAVHHHDKSLSYFELNQGANALAHLLIDEEVLPNALVGICMDRSLAMAVGILGIIKTGAAYVPFDAEYPTERIQFMLASAQCSVIVTQKKICRFIYQFGCSSFYLGGCIRSAYQHAKDKP
ncbi:MAG TPA: AMP-binding protein [Bacteroidia bacterium]|nr:AMP-binding protein [Bacteroidia bacterium]